MTEVYFFHHFLHSQTVNKTQKNKTRDLNANKVNKNTASKRTNKL